MFDTGDVDDDFFTPSKPSTLANIFGKKKKESSDNPTLKYTAPKAEEVTTTTSQALPHTSESQNKNSECLLALAVFAYEWVNGAYVSREKLGFAIMKMLSPPQIRLILYDTGKNTLSLAVASTNLLVKVHKNNCFSYYDESKRNWSLICSNSQNIESIIKELQSYGVQISQENSSDENTPGIQDHVDQVSNQEQSEHELLKKSKASIVSRMALMGQAILPLGPLTNQLSHTCSLNEDVDNTTIRESFIASSNKRDSEIGIAGTSSSSHENDIYCENISALQVKFKDTTDMPSYIPLNRQIIPITSNNRHCENCLNFNSALSEQRVSNSELRINISKIEYKIDKLGDLNTKNVIMDDSTFTADLTRKLLTEYENKIKDQNEIIKQLENKLNLEKINKECSTASCNVNREIIDQFKEYIKDIQIYKSKLKESEIEISNKNAEIDVLKSQIFCKTNEDKDILLHELKDKYANINNELTCLKDENKELKVSTEKKIKFIMNNTYHTLSSCFDNHEQYSGDNIKHVIATTIKELTIKNISI